MHPAQDDAVIAASAPHARALNRKLCEQARHSDTVSTLASPVVGGGVHVSRIEQLMLLARANGAEQPEDWSRSVLHIMHAQGQHVHQAGKALETPEAELRSLVDIAVDFRDTRLPFLDAMQVHC